MRHKALRKLSTPSSRAFWAAVKADASAVRRLPEWRRAGVSAHREARVAKEAPK